MGIPQHVFSELACFYGGVNPFDINAVTNFFKNLYILPKATRQTIEKELKSRNNEPQNEIDDIILAANKITPVVVPLKPIACPNLNLPQGPINSKPPRTPVC